MEADFFDQPILNSPYDYPGRHWELDETGQPTQRISESRRLADFITQSLNRKNEAKTKTKESWCSTKARAFHEEQQYDASSNITRIRTLVDRWQDIPDPSQWNVTPETARLCNTEHHKFSGIRPFFCQVEAAETAIWLTEVAPKTGKKDTGLWIT